MSETKVLLTVCDRAASTVKCIDTLFETAKGDLDICVFDNGSKDERPELMSYYAKALADDKIQQLVCNTRKSMPGVTYSKPWAYNQMIRMLTLFPEKERRYMLVCDNDIYTTPGWLEACISVLESPISKKENIKVVSAWDGPPRLYKTIKTINAGGQKIHIRNEVGGAFWFATVDHWLSMKPMIPDFYDDCHLWRQMNERGQKFAVLAMPLAFDIKGNRFSARHKVSGGEFTKEQKQAYMKELARQNEGQSRFKTTL